MCLTNRNRRVIHIYNGKSETKVYYDRPGTIRILGHFCKPGRNCLFYFAQNIDPVLLGVILWNARPIFFVAWFLAHLSRRLIGELIVYPCSVVRPSSVRPSSVRRPSSTISKIFFSETAGPIVLILHIHHLQVGGKNNCVFVLIG